jgi:hypothetical protein
MHYIKQTIDLKLVCKKGKDQELRDLWILIGAEMRQTENPL